MKDRISITMLEDGIADVRLIRADKMNALDAAMWSALAEAIDELKAKQGLRVVGDQVGTPTPAALIADVTARIISADARKSGTWHLTPHGQTSWHGFGEAIVEGAFERGLLAKKPIVTAIILIPLRIAVAVTQKPAS